jgi:hypothetical protein
MDNEYREGYIAQTAKDYDLPIHIVESCYYSYKEKGLFYEKLEEIIKSRQ